MVKNIGAGVKIVRIRIIIYKYNALSDWILSLLGSLLKFCSHVLRMFPKD